MSKHQQAQIARELAEQIASGHVVVGALLPTEMELCEHYAASRYTVRLALAQLQEQGLISRKKNVGSRVESAQPVSGLLQSLTSLEELSQFGVAHMRDVREIEDVVVDIATAELLGCAGGSRWLRISSVRYDSLGKHRPVGWTDAYIDPAYRDIADAARQEPQALLSSLIETRYGCGIARISQEIRASTIPAHLSEPLEAKEGSAALLILRRYFDAAGRLYEITSTRHPAERFTFSMDLNRSRS